jgi:hypothetical protein
MVLLDTVLNNNDREEDVLAVPVRGSQSYELWYIDNTWLAYMPATDDPDVVIARFPRSYTLQRLARGLDGLPPFALAARSLDADALEVAFGSVPGELMPGMPEPIRAMAENFVWRGTHAEEVIHRTRPPEI